MSEFKVVPVGTIRDAMDALELYASDTLAGTHSAGELRMVLLDAPDVQGEPAAHLRRDQLQQIKTRGPVVGEISPSPRGDMVAVYAALQPAEQQPLEPSLAFDASVHLTNWLNMDWCECDGAHTCGYNEVKRTRDALLGVAEQLISQAWDGEGVPPIGTVCEYHWDDDDWRRCEIVGHYFGSVVAVDVVDASALRLPVDLVRPIKTPEQIAAEEQKPAPYVSALVGALEAACEHHLPIGSRALELASIALAAHRKQGGEK